MPAGWQDDGIFYDENPRKLDVLWPKKRIVASKDTEGMAMADVDGGGIKDLLISNYSRQPFLWIRVLENGGKGDLVTERGWFRQVDWRKDLWESHADFMLHDASIEILVKDVNGDGKAGLI